MLSNESLPTSGYTMPYASGMPWNNEQHILTDNNLYVSRKNNGGISESDYLCATGFVMNVSDSKRIDGLMVSIHKKASAATTVQKVVDAELQFLKNGVAFGPKVYVPTSVWGTLEHTRSYSIGISPTVQITPEDVRSGIFGCAFRCKTTGPVEAHVDTMKMTAFYSNVIQPSGAAPSGV
jgi:hypothetical protein